MQRGFDEHEIVLFVESAILGAKNLTMVLKLTHILTAYFVRMAKDTSSKDWRKIYCRHLCIYYWFQEPLLLHIPGESQRATNPATPATQLLCCNQNSKHRYLRIIFF